MDLKELLTKARPRWRREPWPAEALDALGVPADARALLCVGECSGRDLDSYQADRSRSVGEGRSQRTELDLTDERARLLARCLVDEKGERVYPNDPATGRPRPEDVETISLWPAAATVPLYGVALRLCGLAQAEREGAEKNGGARPGG